MEKKAGIVESLSTGVKQNQVKWCRHALHARTVKMANVEHGINLFLPFDRTLLACAEHISEDALGKKVIRIAE